MRTFFSRLQLTQIAKIVMLWCKLYLILLDILVGGLVVENTGGEWIDMMEGVSFFGIDKDPVDIGWEWLLFMQFLPHC